MCIRDRGVLSGPPGAHFKEKKSNKPKEVTSKLKMVSAIPLVIVLVLEYIWLFFRSPWRTRQKWKSWMQLLSWCKNSPHPMGWVVIVIHRFGRNWTTHLYFMFQMKLLLHQVSVAGSATVSQVVQVEKKVEVRSKLGCIALHCQNWVALHCIAKIGLHCNS